MTVATNAPIPSFDELYRQIQALPEGVTGEILMPGVLSTMSRPGRAHRRVAKVFGVRIVQALDPDVGGTGWWIEPEAEIRFPNDRLTVPDLAGWRVERVPELPDENPLTLLPDWCCEVLSPTTNRQDRLTKLHLHAECGVSHVWLADPEARLIEVYVQHDGLPLRVAAAGESERVRLPPFDLELELGSLWTPHARAP